MKFLLFIFNFKAFEAASLRKICVSPALFLCFFLVISTEIAARIFIAPIGTQWEYWDPRAIAKFDTIRGSMEDGQAPDILIVGDSTGAINVNPSIITSSNTIGWEAWNMASSGNFPLAFEKSTLPILESASFSPKIIIASLIPTGFFGNEYPNASEVAILQSPFCIRQEPGWLYADFLYLARILPALKFFKASFSGIIEKVRQNQGYTAAKGKSEPIQIPEQENLHEARNFQLNQRRFSVIERLAEYSEKNNVKLFLVIPPTLDTSDSRGSMNGIYKEYLERLREESTFSILDLSEFARERKVLFIDRNHLTEIGAIKFSSKIIDSISSENLF